MPAELGTPRASEDIVLLAKYMYPVTLDVPPPELRSALYASFYIARLCPVDGPLASRDPPPQLQTQKRAWEEVFPATAVQPRCK